MTACLARRDCRRQAARALVAGGADVVAALEKSYEQPGTDRELKRLILRLCGRIGAGPAVAFLRRRRHEDDGDLRLEALKALRRIGISATSEERPGVEAAVERELDQAGELRAELVEIGDDASPLAGALRLEVADAVERALLQLSLIHDAGVIQSARRNLSAVSRERQAYAIELLDAASGMRRRKIRRSMSPAARSRSERAPSGSVPGGSSGWSSSLESPGPGRAHWRTPAARGWRRSSRRCAPPWPMARRWCARAPCGPWASSRPETSPCADR